jgi:hypothetical protein
MLSAAKHLVAAMALNGPTVVPPAGTGSRALLQRVSLPLLQDDSALSRGEF